MNDRIPCVVPFCRRTAASDQCSGSGEMICGLHWRLADRSLRRRYARWRRRYDRVDDDGGRMSERIYGLLDRMWKRAKRQAIERAAGITA